MRLALAELVVTRGHHQAVVGRIYGDWVNYTVIVRS